MGRADLHRLIDELPDSEEHAARRFLEYLRDHAQPDVETEDEEPLSLADLAAVRESLEQVRMGDTVTLEEYQRQRGL